MVEIVKVIARGPQGPGGGGSSAATNWVKLALAPVTLTVASNNYRWDGNNGMTIVSQAGSDFSIDPDGTLRSAAGGTFACGGYMSYDTPTIDAGSSAQRFLWYAAQLGDSAAFPELFSAGMDINVPVFDPAALNGSFGVQIFASVPSICSAGGVALANVNVRLIQATGSDSVPTYNDPFLVWQL